LTKSARHDALWRKFLFHCRYLTLPDHNNRTRHMTRTTHARHTHQPKAQSCVRLCRCARCGGE
jgi:hypothetical protein